MNSADQIVDTQENIWHQEFENWATNFLQDLGARLHLNLLNNPEKSSAEIVEAMKVFFLEKVPDQLYESLAATKVNPADFEKSMINSLVLSINKQTNNTNYLLTVFQKANLVDQLTKDAKGNYLLTTPRYGTIKFSSASTDYTDTAFQTIFNQPDRNNGCHEYCQEFLRLAPEMQAVTAICTKMPHNKFYHSFILDGDKVIDIAADLIMDQKSYYNLNQVEVLNQLNYTEFQTVTKNQTTSSLYDLLRLAVEKAPLPLNCDTPQQTK